MMSNNWKIKIPFLASRPFQDEEISSDITLKLQAMKMYLEYLSIDEIGANLGVSKVIVEKWINSFNMHQSANSDCEMVYEIFDDSSVSSGNIDDDDGAKNSLDGEGSSLPGLRWSESSDSEEVRSIKTGAAIEHRSEVPDDTDEAIISTKTMTPQQRANYKRADLKRWNDVPCRCTICKEKFVGANDLRLHVRQRHPTQQYSDTESTNKSYGCGLCFKVFNLFGKLIYHSVSAHVPQLRLR